MKRSWYIEIYKEAGWYKETWYWHLKAGNGKIVADSAEGYDSLGNCQKAVDRILENMRGTVYVVVKQD